MEDAPLYDVAVLGAGPNGLAATAYLATAGLKVVLLEKRFERGGTFASDDYSTPFLYNQAQMFLPLGDALPVVGRLGLADHLVRFIKPPAAVEVVTSGGAVAIGRGGAGLGEAIEAWFAQVSHGVLPFLLSPPVPAAEVDLGLRRQGLDGAAELSELPLEAVVRLADDERHRIALRYAAALCGFFDGAEPLGALGAFALAQVFEPHMVAGGTKNLANALFRVAAAAGAVCHVSSGAERVERRADGFVIACAHGREVQAARVLSTLDLRSNREILSDLVDLTDAADRWQGDECGTFVAHFGVKGELPRPATAEGPAALSIVGFETETDLVEHIAAVTAGRLPAAPAGHLTATTALDPLQASPGPFGPLHTLRFETLAPFSHPDGNWTRRRVAWRRRCWDLCCQAWPELAAATLLAQFADTPPDFAARFGTTRAGTVRQGRLSVAQAFSARPHPRLADSRVSHGGIYFAGGGLHPGIPGLMANAGAAADAICRDRGVEAR